MERAAWTDQRLDDLARRMDAGFARVEGDMKAGFARVGGDIRELRRELRGEIDALRITLLRVGGGMMVGLVGVIAAILARGA
jgi:hypothetical protein